jgi:hypothetical protein
MKGGENMRRVEIVGLCVVAALVLAVAVAPSASASVPTWFECAKTAKLPREYTGDYNNKVCTSENTEGKGEYELREGVRADRRIKGKSATVALHVQASFGEVTVECRRSSYSAVAKLPNVENDVEMIWRECALVGGKKCTSLGAPQKGEIRLHALSGELGYIEESPPVIGLRLELESSPGGAIATFTCGNLEATVSGALIGTQQGDVNVISTHSELVFTAGEPPSDLLEATLCGEYVEALAGEPCTGETPAGEDDTMVLNSGPWMIKTQ